jgi:TetR/AcrR family transcriptional repressor of nem operon
MGYSQAQKAESRQRVLESASKQIREDGLEALGVADCMRRAGLTHGAFYSHFESRDALIVAALDYALAQSEKRLARVSTYSGSGEPDGPPSLHAVAEVFLNERHLKNPGSGCALCALAGEARHATPEVRERLTRYVHALVARIARSLGDGKETAALGIVATIVGAVTLARAVNDDGLAQSILSASLEQVVAQGERAA